VNNPDELLRTVLPPALEVLTAWSLAETEADPTVFHHAMNRAFGDAAGGPGPVAWDGRPDVRTVLAVWHPARRTRGSHRPLPQRGRPRRPPALPRPGGRAAALTCSGPDEPASHVRVVGYHSGPQPRVLIDHRDHRWAGARHQRPVPQRMGQAHGLLPSSCRREGSMICRLRTVVRIQQSCHQYLCSPRMANSPTLPIRGLS
jgi:hypothetical protein